jgi:hypothetical protein
MDQANATLADMVADGAITAEERKRMVLTTYTRRKSDLFAPFAANGQFQNFIVEDFEMPALPDAAWNDYEKDRNAEAFATKCAQFFRAIFMPSLACGLERVQTGDAGAIPTFADRLEARLKRRLASQPMPAHSLVQILVLAKRV